MNIFRYVGIAVAVAAAAHSPALAAPESLASPDGRVAITVDQDGGGTPTWSVRFDGDVVIAPSTLGLDLTDGQVGPGAAVTGADRSTGDTRYALVAGKTTSARDHYNELVVNYRAPGPDGRPFQLVFRAYDDGAALRYRLPPVAGLAVAVRAEATRFAFPRDYDCWGLNLGRFGTSHEGEYDPVKASRIRDGNLFEAPLVCKTGVGDTTFALAEADLKDWAGLYLSVDRRDEQRGSADHRPAARFPPGRQLPRHDLHRRRRSGGDAAGRADGRFRRPPQPPDGVWRGSGDPPPGERVTTKASGGPLLARRSKSGDCVVPGNGLEPLTY